MEILDSIPFLQQLPLAVREIILRLLLLVLVLIFVFVLSRIVVRMLMRPLRAVAQRTKNQYDDILVEAIQRPFRLVVIAIAITVTTSVLNFGPELKTFSEHLSRSFIIAAVVFVGYNMISVIAITPESVRRITGFAIEDRLLPFVRTVARVFLLIMGLLFIIQEFGYDVTGLIASFGVVGLAFSLAAQDTAANIFGFTAIVSDNPFQVGDFIVTGDFSGIVEQVGVRSTRVRRLDQSLVTVPNNYLTNKPVTNWSRLEKRRYDFTIGVTYSTRADQMSYLVDRIREMLRAREHVDSDTVVVHFVSFGSSSLDIRIVAIIWLKDWAAFTAECEQINLAIMNIVDELGLSFAFPSTSLYVESLPTSDAPAPSVPFRYGRTPKAEDVAAITSDVPDQANEEDR